MENPRTIKFLSHKPLYDTSSFRRRHSKETNDKIKTVGTNYNFSFFLELELMVRSQETNSQEIFARNVELERIESEKSRSVREVEKQLISCRTEKDDLSRDLCEAQEKLKLQSKELKDALQQRKLAMSEYTEVTDKLSELRQQKQKMSRQVRDKEEELESSLQKIDNLRQDIRKAEKLRRELEVRAEEAFAETAKERKAREKLEIQVNIHNIF